MSILDRLFGGQQRAAVRETERRVREFRAEVGNARLAPARDDLERLHHRPAALGLSDDDVALELEILDALLEAVALREATALGLPLPVIPTSHRAIGDETCHFLAPASRPDAPHEAGGKLFFTTRRLVYLGSPSSTLGWAHVTEVTDEERDIIVRARPARTLLFRCNSYVDTLTGTHIARELTRAARRPNPV